MFKIFIFIKRKSGITMEQFIDRYENGHAPLAVKHLPNFKKYVRHFVTPYGNDVYAQDEELTYDVVTEAWFDDRDDFDHWMGVLTSPDKADLFAEDEEKLFEVNSIRFATVTDHESELGKGYTSKY